MSAACVAAGDEPLVIRPLPGPGEVTDEVLLGYAAAFLADSPVTQDAVLRSSGRLVEVGRTYDLQLVGMPVAKYRVGLADALRRVTTDTELAERLRRAGDARAEEFAMTSLTDRYLEIYRSICPSSG